MMSLDSITLYLVATMVAALLGAMMVFFGRQENSAALKWWGTAYLLGATSVALWTAAGDRLGPHLYLALNAVGFVACGMVWNAARVFHGRKPNWPGLVLGALAWVAAVTLLDPAASMLRMMIEQPFSVAARSGQYDVICTVAGGGLSGQAGAVRHGISKALTYFEPELRTVLKKGGFLTRDSRVVERKKYGKAKARRSFQFSKR